MFTLYYNGVTVTLPSPNYQDKLSTNYRKIINKTRGNMLIIAPKMGYDFLNSIRTYSYQFSYFDAITRQNLLNFLSLTTGQVVTVTDYTNLVYSGIITTPSNDVIQSGRNNNEFTLEIEVIDPTIGDTIPVNGLHGNKLITQGYGL